MNEKIKSILLTTLEVAICLTVSLGLWISNNTVFEMLPLFPII